MAYSLRIIRILTVAVCLGPMAVAAQQSASTPPESDALAHPAQHLAAAGERLDSISGKVPADASAPLAELRKHFGELTSNYRAKGKEVEPPISQQDPSSSLAGDWKDNFSDVERDLAVLVGAGNAFAEDFAPTPK